jgi:hypothetical protein
MVGGQSRTFNSRCLFFKICYSDTAKTGSNNASWCLFLSYRKRFREVSDNTAVVVQWTGPIAAVFITNHATSDSTGINCSQIQLESKHIPLISSLPYSDGPYFGHASHQTLTVKVLYADPDLWQKPGFRYQYSDTSNSTSDIVLKHAGKAHCLLCSTKWRCGIYRLSL